MGVPSSHPPILPSREAPTMAVVVVFRVHGRKKKNNHPFSCRLRDSFLFEVLSESTNITERKKVRNLYGQKTPRQTLHPPRYCTVGRRCSILTAASVPASIPLYSKLHLVPLASPIIPINPLNFSLKERTQMPCQTIDLFLLPRVMRRAFVDWGLGSGIVIKTGGFENARWQEHGDGGAVSGPTWGKILPPRD